MSSQAYTPGASLDTVFLGAGQYFKDYGEASQRSLGETKGGGTITIERVIKEKEGDSSYGPQVGSRRKTRVVPIMKFNMMEMSEANMLDITPGGVSTDMTTYDKITENIAISASDHWINIAFVGENYNENDGIWIVYNPLMDQTTEFSPEKDEEIIVEVTMTGHYDPATPRTVPYEIRIPIDDTTPPTVTLVPADDAAAVVISSTITVTFNEAMNVATLNTSNIILMQQDGTAEPYTLSIDATKKIVTVQQASDLQAATDYILMATVGCKDLAGNALAANEVSNFTTA